MFFELRLLLAGIVIGTAITTLSKDYVVISRRRYEKLKKKEEN